MNKKKHHVSLRLSEEDRSRLEALKGDYSLSYTIRHLIHKSFSEGFKMPKNDVIDLRKKQEKLVLELNSSPT